MDIQAEAYRNLQFASMEVMRSCTCIIMLDQASYKAHGTGVFIQIQEHYFLVSAAHVMDRHGEFFIFLSQEKEIYTQEAIPTSIGQTIAKRMGLILLCCGWTATACRISRGPTVLYRPRIWASTTSSSLGNITLFWDFPPARQKSNIKPIFSASPHYFILQLR